MKQLYENNLFRKERISVFETSEGSQINGIIKGVSDSGELLVETESNPLQKLQLKEVKLIY
jgi:BirA family biotin operon repressor/biotin-[acetyl-CoA-carboxylase] ligase